MILKIATLACMAIFYIAYFTKMIQQKKQGIRTDQLGRGKEGFVKFVEVALKTITYLLPAGQIVSIFLYRDKSPLWIQIAGVVITALGVLAFILSVTHMKDNWRAGVQREDKTSLVTDGIYAISRNPAFLGFDLMYLGILMTFFNWPLFGGSVVAYILFHLQIVNVEEDFLTETFGQAYLDYKKKVCRYFGRKRFR